MKKSIIVLLTLLFLSTAGHVAAQLVGEHIRDYHERLEVREDSMVEVSERILYDFDSLQRHGIIREIPTIKTNDDGKKFRLEFTDISVTDEAGKDYDFKETTENDILTLKIGDAYRYVTGVHEYNIHYTVKGAITYFSDHDELYWNVVGTEWDIPVGSASAEISLPKSVPPETVYGTCYTGPAGSRSSACSIDNTGQDLRLTTSQTLQAGDGFTAVVGFKNGIVAHVEPQEVIAFTDTWYGRILSIAGIAALVAAIIAWYIVYPLWLPIKWWRQGRDPKTGGPARAWFDPPQTPEGRKLSPAETGTLIDEEPGMKDVLAMIIDLARRGHFRIQEKEKDVFYLVKSAKRPAGDTLLPFESYFIDQAFAAGKELKIKDAQMISTVEHIKKSLYSSMVKEGYFAENPEKTHNFYNGIIATAVTTFNVPLVISALIFGRNMAKRTLFGAQQRDISLSLKNFLTSQERQLEFQAEKQMFFEKLLPYAVAFGVESVWAKRFADFNLRQPTWYQAYNTTGFNSRTFVHGMHSSFNQFTASATPTRSSSGFSSGFSGGSSGGGGGGGGGGSW